MSYDDVEARVKEFTEYVVKCIYDSDCNTNACRRPRDINVIVSPSVGSPGGRWKFKGEVGDFTSKVLLEVSMILDRMLEERAPISTLVLDLTHGINFMPSAMLSLAGRIASLIIVRQLEGIKVEVYNSDPYPPGVKQEGEMCREVRGSIPRLNVNLVESWKMERILIPHAFPGTLAEPVRDFEDPQVKNTMNELKELRVSMTWARRVLSSLYYPLPLMLVYSCNDPEFPYPKVGDVLTRTLNIWKKWVKINETSVEKVFRLIDDDIYALLLASFTCKGLKKLVKTPSPSGEVDIESLRNLKTIYSKVSEVHETLIEHELSKIEESKKEELSKTLKPETTQTEAYKPECIKLADLKHKQKLSDKVDKRIMIAHAGFQEDFTELCINEKGDIMLKYSKDYKKILEDLGLPVGKKKN